MFLLCASAAQVADFHSFILMSFCQEKKVYEEYTITFLLLKGFSSSIICTHEDFLGNLERTYGFLRAWLDKELCQLHGAVESLNAYCA